MNSWHNLFSVCRRGATVKKPNEEKSFSEDRLSNYETSAYRWAFDALLAEFSALRDEMITLKEQTERTYTYLLALLGAILASQFISSSWSASLNRHASIYLVVALLALWFPVNNITGAVDIIAIGLYVREILAPKLNSIIGMVAGDVEKQLSLDTGHLLGITPELLREISRWDTSGKLLAPMSWEEFLPKIRPGGQVRQLLMAPVYFTRIAFLYSPSVVLVGIFFRVRQVLGIGDIVLAGLTVFLMLLILSANLTMGSIATFSLRRGIFREKRTAVSGTTVLKVER